MKFITATSTLLGLLAGPTSAFAPVSKSSFGTIHFGVTEDVADAAKDAVHDAVTAIAEKEKELRRQKQKQALLGLLGGRPSNSDSNNKNKAYDPVFADPLTKQPLSVTLKGPILGGGTSPSVLRLSLNTADDPSRIFEGRTDSYINLLEPAKTENDSTLDDVNEETTRKTSVSSSPILSSLLTLTPPPLRSVIANNTNIGVEYIPMRDLFTSPSVSFAYERGWRQGFAAAGFPGADKEFEMAKEYFAPVTGGTGSVVVDMSCATGLFTRRFAKSNEYSRVIGCDYSDSMLTEARRRIRADPDLNSSTSSSTRLDLVRCDVANIPLQTGSIDALHAGAAMHCWPEIGPSLKEIHRVLKPGGRYFATTFLGNYFSTVAGIDSANGVEPSMQAFQYFPTVEFLRDLLTDAGFEEEKVSVEVMGRSCVIIRCEK
mmetsp:Transcript_10006/g.20650  ORF Transcript_10006/g.20650 Transcript_10006/m.20650 type:complete len:430 (-) Transcript_10006:138-1427(-)|eukprot:CAMPEP_0171332134 /NCGR_PEP_ID=MMETSP0878-20121228/3176_1 /TAXON_ID=67004 /ORGANISM="Thalassiosira weissflogii, Strain CCMP1336" /LENGTH=429 /DNA_ID=CAMNT_0011832833 /DNA_START=127 /DNA_END=1416 /DNA_ORIENTATION=-